MEQTLDPRADYANAGTSASPGKSAASWPAIIAGAFVAAALTLVLIALGSGLGFASISPWAGHGMSAATFAATTAIWLIVTQWLSSAVGGYIAGRLRTRWIGTHPHEVFFRDTAHGLVTWAVATVLVAVMLGAMLFSAMGAGLHAASGVAAAGVASPAAVPGPGAMAPGSMGPGAMDRGGPGANAGAYGFDKLFRAANPSGNSGAASMQADPRAEAGHILAHSAAAGNVSDEDRAYLAQLVASRTGLSPADAQKRVDDFVASAMDTEAKARAAADTARKDASRAAIFTALSMLIGAFIASVSAALGGRLRDEHL
jgi:hypothetical protein